MSNFLVGILMAISTGTWIYSKTMRRTGGNNTSSLVAAGIAGAFAFIVTLTALDFLERFL